MIPGAGEFLDRCIGTAEIGVVSVQLVNYKEPGKVHSIGVLPRNFGANFHSRNRIHQEDGPVGHAQCRDHFAYKIRETRGVEQIHLIAAQLQWQDTCRE